ncbi:nucleotidyltransferase domain-containing protein [Natroniella acetigena]|uniref:type VII toxin-antitoxin system MntA family adenylyltransferase antitoxin n=1 Tax=Natroniella acetigena TaxID=52004 RepID=UPI00200A2D1C|nr:nucleotidyltransferase domain-containing protein [Natroniella acetigena]MCK8828588.1 nucleotidyltransferase domain-containing protein [Natroniella acetigena]
MSLEVELKQPTEIIAKYNIKLLVVFGSYGTRFMTEKSDLDLAYLSKDLLTKDQELQLLHNLINFYQYGNIDLVNLKKATPALKFEVAKKGRVLFEREDDFLQFQLYASRVFADTKHLREMREEVLNEKIKNL